MRGSAAWLNLLFPTLAGLYLCICCVYTWVGMGFSGTPYCFPMAWWWRHSENPTVSSSTWNNHVVVLFEEFCMLWPAKPGRIKTLDVYWVIKYFLSLFIHQIFIECRGPEAKFAVLHACKLTAPPHPPCVCLERLCGGQAVFTHG